MEPLQRRSCHIKGRDLYLLILRRGMELEEVLDLKDPGEHIIPVEEWYLELG